MVLSSQNNRFNNKLVKGVTENYENRVVKAHLELQQFFQKFEGDCISSNAISRKESQLGGASHVDNDENLDIDFGIIQSAN